MFEKNLRQHYKYHSKSIYKQRAWYTPLAPAGQKVSKQFFNIHYSSCMQGIELRQFIVMCFLLCTFRCIHAYKHTKTPYTVVWEYHHSVLASVTEKYGSRYQGTAQIFHRIWLACCVSHNAHYHGETLVPKLSCITDFSQTHTTHMTFISDFYEAHTYFTLTMSAL